MLQTILDTLLVYLILAPCTVLYIYSSMYNAHNPSLVAFWTFTLHNTYDVAYDITVF